MACCNPDFVRYDSRYYKNYYVYQIPCGYCLNCRKDKQQYYIDRAEYEYKTRLSGAFVTFTYDDIHLIERCSVINPNGGIERDSNGNPLFSTRVRDVQLFIDRLRKRVNFFYATHPDVKPNVLMQPDFSYLYVCEYGDKFNRPHAHILFFGLDFAFCQKLFNDSWSYGLIDSLPILDGGIRYVVKYLDKQTFGAVAKETYDDRGLERPKINLSQGFGKRLLLDNSKDIIENGMTYKVAHNLRRPISQYWKKLLTGGLQSRDTSKHFRAVDARLNRIKFEMRHIYHLKDTSPQAREEFNLRKLQNREEILEKRIRQAGYPVESYKDIRFSRYHHLSYHNVDSAPVGLIRLAVAEYINSLEVG